VEQNKEDSAIHRQITYEGRSYQYASGCPCSGCESIRRYPNPSLCDWCGEIHCGGPEHCTTERHENGSGFRGESETISGAPERDLEDLCRIIRDRISTITQLVKEKAEMTIPRYQGGSIEDGPARGGRKTTTTNRENQGYGNLTIADLSDNPQDARILGCLVEEQVRYEKKQSVVVVKVLLDGKTKLWTLTTTNPNLETLTKAFGDNEQDWEGETIQLVICKPNFKGQRWPEAIVPKKPARGK
jgi:hypothetical protein